MEEAHFFLVIIGHCHLPQTQSPWLSNKLWSKTKDIKILFASKYFILSQILRHVHFRGYLIKK